MAKRNPARLEYDETTGRWLLNEGKSEELCTDGKPHEFTNYAICSFCGITKLEHMMRYGKVPS